MEIILRCISTSNQLINFPLAGRDPTSASFSFMRHPLLESQPTGAWNLLFCSRKVAEICSRCKFFMDTD